MNISKSGNLNINLLGKSQFDVLKIINEKTIDNNLFIEKMTNLVKNTEDK
jgi:hypothetical protein